MCQKKKYHKHRQARVALPTFVCAHTHAVEMSTPKCLPKDISNLPTVVVLQAPPAVRVQVVHPIGGLDLSDPGWLGLLSQCSGPAWARDWGDEDQDFRPKERDTEREGDLPAFISRWKINNLVGTNSKAGNTTHGSFPQSISPSEEMFALEKPQCFCEIVWCRMCYRQTNCTLTTNKGTNMCS